eukprot:5942614-Pyramimonas_sp.AAC.1
MNARRAAVGYPGTTGEESDVWLGFASCRFLTNDRLLGFPGWQSSWHFQPFDGGGPEGFWWVRSRFGGGLLIRFE